MDIKHLADLDAKDFYREIMKRPVMYVGSKRLDYLSLFADGFLLYRDVCEIDIAEVSSWPFNFEIQYWLLLQQSVVLRSLSISGWSLFYRCFGTQDIALSHFAQYLHAEMPKPEDVPALTPPSDLIDIILTELPLVDTVAFEVSVLHRKMEKDATKNAEESLIKLIKKLIDSVCDKHDLIRLYVRRESCFCQVRFIYHTDSGWKDDVDIISNPDNYAALITLHAYIECMEDIEINRLCKHGDYYGTVNNEQEYSWPDLSHQIVDNKTFYIEYEQWRTQFTSTYIR